MVIASHVIITAYGFWLPNDPRGSWSDFVGAWELYKFGRATHAHTRRSVAYAPHDVAARLAAKRALKYPPVIFTGVQGRAIGRATAAYANKIGLTIWACSVLPDHTHMVVCRHRLDVEPLINGLKAKTTRQFVNEGIHPLAAFSTKSGRPPKAWARGCWKVYLECSADVRSAIEYVRANPMKEGRPPQTWSFVTEYA